MLQVDRAKVKAKALTWLVGGGVAYLLVLLEHLLCVPGDTLTPLGASALIIVVVVLAAIFLTQTLT